MSRLQTALRYSLEGPLHRAVEELEAVLRAHPDSKEAGSHLADVYCRLGRYEEALSVLSRLKDRGAWGKEFATQEKRIAEIRKDLAHVEKARFERGAFLSHAIVPDGKGGYFVDTLGFPGTWQVLLNEERPLNPGGYLRLLKSLCRVNEEIRKGSLGSDGGAFVPAPDFAGEVRITGDLEQDLTVSFTEVGREAYFWQVEAGWDFLFLERNAQRRKIAEKITSGDFRIVRADRPASAPETLPQNLPKVLVVSLGLASDYGVTILRDRLLQQGIPSTTSHIRSRRHMEAYLASYEEIPGLGGFSPDIFAVSVLDAVVEDACSLIAEIRRMFPRAFVVVGGSTSQTPEQFCSLVPDFDAMIRGDGDEMLPQLARIIGGSNRTDRFSRAQIEAFKRLSGGLILQQGRFRLVHRLDVTNVPDRYHLPHPGKKKTIYYWQTSRGCPYDCRFCYKWSGKRYHMVVPWEDDRVDLPLARRSASAMIEFLLCRLAMERTEEISPGALAAILKEARRTGQPLETKGPKEKIFIVIEDDDFLIHRERVLEFCGMVDELGLQAYFEFSAITSVRTLYRGRDTVDREILDRLKQSGFISLDIGSDGLCQATIDENEKGYTLDRHVIPLNALLKEMGFFAFNNTIITTPYSTIPHFIESLIFYILCPYPINIALEIGILAHIGTKYTNEDIVNQQYDWSQGGEIKGHYKKLDNFMVPLGFPEYAVSGSQLISYADPKVFDLVVKFPHQDPMEFITRDIPQEELEAVVRSWSEAGDDRPEMRALGRSITRRREISGDGTFASAILAIKEEMGILGLTSFVEHYRRIEADEIRNDPLYRWITESMQRLVEENRQRNWPAVEQELRRMLEKTPRYFRPQQELIMLLLHLGKISDAVERFAGYQLIHPDVLFYFLFFGQFSKALNIEEEMGKNRPFFHIPRYYTISPIYYYLARLKELAGGSRVKGFSFSRFSPSDVEALYDLFDYLTIASIKGALAKSIVDIPSALRTGNELCIMGIPVRLADDMRLFLNLHRIDPDRVLEIGPP